MGDNCIGTMQVSGTFWDMVNLIVCACVCTVDKEPSKEPDTNGEPIKQAEPQSPEAINTEGESPEMQGDSNWFDARLSVHPER